MGFTKTRQGLSTLLECNMSTFHVLIKSCSKNIFCSMFPFSRETLRCLRARPRADGKPVITSKRARAEKERMKTHRLSRSDQPPASPATHSQIPEPNPPEGQTPSRSSPTSQPQHTHAPHLISPAAAGPPKRPDLRRKRHRTSRHRASALYPGR